MKQGHNFNDHRPRSIPTNSLTIFSEDQGKLRPFERGDAINFIVRGSKFEKGLRQEGTWNIVEPGNIDPITNLMIEVPRILDQEPDINLFVTAKLESRLTELNEIRQIAWMTMAEMPRPVNDNEVNIVWAELMVANPIFIAHQAVHGGGAGRGGAGRGGRGGRGNAGRGDLPPVPPAPPAQIGLPDSMKKSVKEAEVQYQNELRKLNNHEFEEELRAKFRTVQADYSRRVNDYNDKAAKVRKQFHNHFGDTALHRYVDRLNKYEFRQAWREMKLDFSGANYGQSGQHALLNLLQTAKWEPIMSIVDFLNAMDLIRKYLIEAGGTMEDIGHIHLVRSAIKNGDEWEKPWSHVLSHTMIMNSTYSEMCESLYARNTELTHDGWWNKYTVKSSVNAVAINDYETSGNPNYKGKKPFCSKCRRNHYDHEGCLPMGTPNPDRACFNCQSKDHVMKNCPLPRKESGVKRSNENSDSSDSSKVSETKGKGLHATYGSNLKK